MWRDEAYLLDILLASREARQIAQGESIQKFTSDRKLQLAIMHLIQIIGEAARSISPEFKQAHPEVPWNEIVGMRNKLVYEYFRIIPEKVWEAVEKDLPQLIQLIEPLVPPNKATN